MRVLMQSLIRSIFPPQCVSCSAPTEIENRVCGSCWSEFGFIQGASCDLCGTPVLGTAVGTIHCDDCLTRPRPWIKGRAAITYRDRGRKMVLGLKHGDRTDFVPALASWMVTAGREVLSDEALLVPVPLHPSRLRKRKYNQAAELAKAIRRQTHMDAVLEGLIRIRPTEQLGASTADHRFRVLQGAIVPNSRQSNLIEGRDVVLIDDVMTSGATLAACASACHMQGAKQISILVLARAVKDA